MTFHLNEKNTHRFNLTELETGID